MKALGIVLAVVFFILAVCALLGAVNLGAHGAGRALGLDGSSHVKHGVLYVVLAVLALIWVRFQSASTVRGVR